MKFPTIQNRILNITAWSEPDGQVFTHEEIMRNKFVNCNDCTNINLTEEQQHRIGVDKAHRCLVFKTRLFHHDNHKGVDPVIVPCCYCIKESNFEARKR